jgi:peptidoglycan/xylan/chitin deacetylase (PgdA/CDA1 family)
MSSSEAIDIPGRRVWIAALKQIRPRRSVILGYHGVGNASLRDDPSLLQLPPERFRSQVEMLVAAGFRFVTIGDLVGRAKGGAPPPGLAALTFDDGMRNNHSTALPILGEFGIPATIYVTVDFLGRNHPWIGPGGGGAMLSEAELRDLVQAGWQIGAHTMGHPDLSTLDYRSCRDEIEESRDALERIADVRVDTFAYPFGRYGASAVAAVRDAGMRSALTIASGSWDPHELTRAMISAADPLPVILLKLVDRDESALHAVAMWMTWVATKLVRV